jgi:hypothetical protein
LVLVTESQVLQEYDTWGQIININNNGPLFIVDGIPINNNVYGVGGLQQVKLDLPTDYGNGASEINQENIEKCVSPERQQHLLFFIYGWFSAKRYIVITTKSGKRSKGLGVSILLL